MLGYEWTGGDIAGHQRENGLPARSFCFTGARELSKETMSSMSKSSPGGKQRKGNEEMWSGFTILSSCEKVTVEARFN